MSENRDYTCKFITKVSMTYLNSKMFDTPIDISDRKVSDELVNNIVNYINKMFSTYKLYSNEPSLGYYNLSNPELIYSDNMYYLTYSVSSSHELVMPDVTKELKDFIEFINDEDNYNNVIKLDDSNYIKFTLSHYTYVLLDANNFGINTYSNPSISTYSYTIKIPLQLNTVGDYSKPININTREDYDRINNLMVAKLHEVLKSDIGYYKTLCNHKYKSNQHYKIINISKSDTLDTIYLTVEITSNDEIPIQDLVNNYVINYLSDKLHILNNVVIYDGKDKFYHYKLSEVIIDDNAEYMYV